MALMSSVDERPEEDLSVTALYTSATWAWGGLERAEIFDTAESRAVFRVTNLFLSLLKLFRWRLKSLKHSLLHRHVLIDRLVQRSEARQVLELAAGLSRRGLCLADDPKRTVVEVDLPHVTARKRALISGTDAGLLERENWRLVSADVSEVPLAQLVDSAHPTFVIAEGLCMYLQPEEQRTLWRRVARLLGEAGGSFSFDLVPWIEQPRPGLLGRGLEWLMKRFTGGKSFERDLRTREEIAADLKDAGFDSVQALDPSALAHEYALPFPDKKTQQLVFLCHRRPAPLGDEAAL